MHETLPKTFLKSFMVLLMSPEVHDVAAILSKIELSEPEQKDICSRLKPWGTNRWKSLYKRAKNEVVIPQIYKNLQYMEETPPLWNQVKASYYNAWIHKQNLLSESKNVASALSQHSVEFLFLKGMAVDNLYKTTWRAMADIDILVEDFTSAKESLSEIGYTVDDMWAGCQGKFGVANLYCLERKTKVDLHFGEYPVHSLGSFHLPLWKRKRQGEVPCISYEDSMLALASHVFNHGFYLMRDINDVYVILQEELDWQYIRTQAHHFHLEKPLCTLLRAAAAVYDIHIDCTCTGSFLYRYGRRTHILQHLLQLHHLLLFSQMKSLLRYPGYCISSYLFDSGSIIDPPWIGRASPRWINRTDRKRLFTADEDAFRSAFGSDTTMLHDMCFILDNGEIYIEKQNLQKKDIVRGKEIMRGVLNEGAEKNTGI